MLYFLSGSGLLGYERCWETIQKSRQYKKMAYIPIGGFIGLFQLVAVFDYTESTIAEMSKNNTHEVYMSRKENQHLRMFWGNEKVGQWRTQFDEDDEFKETHCNLLIKLGYEQTRDWI